MADELVLIVAADSETIERLRVPLLGAQFALVVASEPLAVVENLSDARLAAVVADADLAWLSGPELAFKAKRANPDAEVVLVARNPPLRLVVDSVKRGAADFVEMSDVDTELGTAVRSAIAMARAERLGAIYPALGDNEETTRVGDAPSGPTTEVLDGTDIIGETTDPSLAVELVLPGETRGLLAGRYQIKRRLGGGGMGEVFEAEDGSLSRSVAVKVLNYDLDRGRRFEMTERFKREAAVMGRLAHPSIATVHDFGIDEDRDVLYIVMEFVEGTSLREVLHEEGRLPTARALRIVHQVMQALVYMHTEGVVHRDIKPENILVTGEDEVKVVDFGVAHVPGSQLTQAGEAVGSPSYLSPEAVRAQPIDHRSDQFSLATVLIELLSGQRVFADRDVPTTFRRIASAPTPRLSELGVAAPPGLQTLIDRMHEKDKELRFQDEELLEALSELARV